MKSFRATVSPAPARPRMVGIWLGEPKIIKTTTNTVITCRAKRTKARRVSCRFRSKLRPARKRSMKRPARSTARTVRIIHNPDLMISCSEAR